MAPQMTSTKLPRKPIGTRRLSFTEAHATGLTIVLFGVAALALGLVPSVPTELRPIDLSSEEKQLAALDRVLKKPKMTLSTSDEASAAERATAGADDESDVDVALAESLADDASATAPSKDTPAIDVALDDDAVLTARIPGGAALATAPIDDDDGARARVAMKTSKRSEALDALAKSVGAEGAAIENPCVRPVADGCARTALDPLFQALDEVARGRDGTHVNVVALGNSLVASDHVTDVVRARLVERFGDGGRGFLLPERLGPAGRRVRTGTASSEWTVHTFAQKPADRPVFGFTGSSHESKKKGDRVTWTLAGANLARLFWLDHEDAQPFVVEVDGQVLARVTPERAFADQTLDLEIPEGGQRLSVVADGKGVVLFGVALTKDAPGISWDTIGVPASESAMYAAADEGIFTRQLMAREPDAVVVMMGGNEIRSLAFKWTTPDEVRRDYGALLDRVRRAAPDAACLAIAPIDAAKATAAGAELTTRKEVEIVVEIEREVAREKGCAFFDLWHAMGGPGSLSRFHDASLVHEDLVHPKGKGGDVLGQLIARALFDAYQATPPPTEKVAARRRLVPPRTVALTVSSTTGKRRDPASALPRLTDALMGFGTASARRVAIGFFGDELVAEEAFTDRVRDRFSSRYGARGRGLVPFGFKEPALLRSRVTRDTSGQVLMLDGRRVVLGGAMGLSGQAARLMPGAKVGVSFCDGCQDASTSRRGTLALTWLFTPDMGTADVYVNDVAVGVLSPADAPKDSDLARLDIPVLGERHTVRVHARDDGGPVHVLSVAQEVEKPGVVVDAIGLAGTTGMTMQRWRTELISAQLAARAHDVVVTTWGSNEAWIADLDVGTYRHHFARSLALLRGDARDCVVVTPLDRPLAKKQKGTPPARDLVERVQREVAAEQGCAHFSMPKAAKAAGIAPSGALARADAERLADLFVDDVLAVVDYGIARTERDLKEREEAARAARHVAQAPATGDEARATSDPTTDERAKGEVR